MHTRQQASYDHAESQYLGAQVGALSGGLAGALWSPDGNLLCLVSLQGQLLLMNKVSTARAAVTWHAPCCGAPSTSPIAGRLGTGCRGSTCCGFTHLQERASIVRALVAWLDREEIPALQSCDILQDKYLI